MKAKDLLNVFDELDRNSQVWLYTPAMFRILFPEETENSLKMSLRRHVQSGLMKKVKNGLYANERAQCAPPDKLPALVAHLKPGEINYVSKHNRLSELGMIAQMPLNSLAVMTSGTSHTFHTCYGIVTFTHTQRPIEFILDHTALDYETGLLVADRELALKDGRRSGDNALKDLIREQSAKNN